MTKYRRKPVVIDAIQWKGDNRYDVYLLGYEEFNHTYQR